MTTHRLDARADTVVDVFAAARPAVLTVDPGDTVVVRSLDASGSLRPHGTPGERVPTLLPQSAGHCLTGPIAVRGARPGDVLAVRFDAVDPDDWGWTVAGARDTWLNRRLRLTPGEPAWLRWTLDWDPATRTGTGTDQFGHRVRLAPFLGVVGMPPEPDGEHSTIPPRPVGGGNIDCRSLVAGSTLHLPVTVAGGLLCLGDGHAAQGDGEVSGTAIECGMTSTVTLDLVADPPVSGIYAQTPEGRLTFGFDASLDEAAAQALDAMVDWLARLHGLGRAEALALASAVVDLRVTQVANRTWGVHALLRPDAVR
ncbi:acetamidase/formamidase family protein [Nakamurella endophytica]|uniref:Acetamidase n=1 Tax=Nakamurella endophytica TaxID=1748367 RepID=A0A917SMG6_9ACTN|nr:acetamidase/formamidase family protein [Nakamurella endophytica]GGL88314.1 acetamidase [Nakamurella endophytica]